MGSTKYGPGIANPSGAAEKLASRLCSAASDHGRTRTQSAGAGDGCCPRAGHTGQALARLADFLPVTRDVDYVRPLVRHREVGRTLAACG